jgi:predicted enzyme related to lactoylglutathione lyase
MTIRFLRSRTTLPVRDVVASADFYRTLVGFKLVSTMGEPPDFALLADPASGVGLGLVKSDEPAVAPFACCYIDVEGVEELHQRCLDASANVSPELTRHPWGNVDFVITDPDGHQIAIGQPPS